MILTLICLLLATIILRAFWQDLRRLRTIPRLAAPDAPGPDGPLISILIPARNEERGIARCLSGALAQGHPQIEVIVLDDGSTDRTPQILESYHDPRLRVLRGRPLLQGWVGKCHACQQLGLAARGEWLLFLDADTAPGPDLAASLLRHAHKKQIDLLTLFPFLELGSFWERAVLPPFLAMITALFPFERLADPAVRPDEVLANGQCILVRREAYLAVGGHAAVYNEVLEDVRLAQAIRAAGYRVGGAEGMRHLAVRMYTNGREVAAGLAKNAAAGYRSGGARSIWAMLRMVVMAFGWAGMALAGLAGLALGQGIWAWACLALAALCLGAGLAFWGLLYRSLYRLSPLYSLIWPLGLLSYMAIAGYGMWRVRSGRGVVWKGRVYSG